MTKSKKPMFLKEFGIVAAVLGGIAFIGDAFTTDPKSTLELCNEKGPDSTYCNEFPDTGKSYEKLEFPELSK